MAGDSDDAAALTSALGAAQQGDEGAFRILYRQLQPLLVRYLRALVGSDADDVAGEAWLQIARDLRSFRGDWDKFRGWAVTIARHRALDHLRAQRRRPAVSTPVHEMLDLPGEQDAAQGALDAVATDEALALIAGLPRDQAEAVLLRVMIGLDAKTAAQILGKRAGAVRTAAYRGLRTLAQHLDRPPPGDRPTAARRTAVTSRQTPALKEVR
jgi:RNA polymerase sigma-70 factor (ECF subfamily)